MAVQPEDKQTADILGELINHPTNDEAAQAAKAARDAEDMHLAADHHLVKVQAYVRDDKKAEQKSKGAERVKKFREKLKAEGLVQLAVPAEIAEAVKATGGDMNVWLASRTTTKPADPVTVEVVKEVIKTVPAALTVQQQNDIAVGRAVAGLSGWRRWLVSLALGY